MTGTEKQKSWAMKLRAKRQSDCEEIQREHAFACRKAVESGKATAEQTAAAQASIAASIASLLAKDDAAYWVDTRDEPTRLLLKAHFVAAAS